MPACGTVHETFHNKPVEINRIKRNSVANGGQNKVAHNVNVQNK